MSTEPTSQNRAAWAAELTAALQRWAKRWSVNPVDLEAFMEQAVLMTQFNAIVQDHRSTVLTDIPAAARSDLAALITRAAGELTGGVARQGHHNEAHRRVSD